MAKPAKESAAESAKLQGYLDAISKYDREYKAWETRAAKIIKRYRDEGRVSTADTNGAKFNILWSNVQTLVPATFARIPQPDVSRRFRDQDPTGRVAALLLERGLEFEVQHYPDYRDTMTQCVHDRFLGGRGTAWIRYEPHFKPGSGQITEDVEAEVPEEQLDYECAPVDYVHWRDFGHSVARTWEEVTLVWRKVYMSEAAVTERFGPEIAKKLPYDSTPDDLKRADRNAQSDVKQQARIYELWDKEDGVACWFSKSMKEFLDEKLDPLKLQQFFPCPKPLYATLTNETLVPVPDFTLYQDQAVTLDTLADRAAGLVNMLQLKGVYDASADASLARLFTEGSNGNLLPVKNWAAFAEKNGLKGQVDVYDLTPIARALDAVYLAAAQQKEQVYEIMGISDIVRGSSNPNETLGAQELKGQYASMRLRSMQSDVSRFATDILQLKAQVMCSKFNPATLVAIAAAEQLSQTDLQQVYQFAPGVDPQTGQPTPPQPVPGPDGKPLPHGPAMVLLVGEERIVDPEAESPNPLRSFRVEVNADSMIQMNEEVEKKARMEFLQANGAFMEKAIALSANAGPATPIIVPLIMEMWKFGVTGFKVGKTIEGQFDEAIDKLKDLAAQPQPPRPDPEMMKVQAQAQESQARLQHDQQAEGMRLQHDQQVAQAQHQREIESAQVKAQMESQKMHMEDAHRQREMAASAQLEQFKIQSQGQLEEAQALRQQEFDRWKAELEADTKIIVAEISASSKPEPGEGGEEGAAAKPKRRSPLKVIAEAQADFMEKIGAQGEALAQSQAEMAEMMRGHQERQAADAQAPVVGKRGPDGRIATVQRGGRTARVVRGPDGVQIVPETVQ